MYDLKLVWSFMQNGFVASPFQRYFPRLPHASHDDLLPEAVDPYSAQSVRNLEDVLDETMSKLSAQSGEQHPPLSQKTEDDASPNQEEVSIDSSIFALPSTTDETPTKAFSPDGPSSPDTVEMKRPDNEVIERHIQEEPLVWAKSLLVHCEGIVKHAIAGGADAIVTPLPRLHPDGESLYAERIAGQVNRPRCCLSS